MTQTQPKEAALLTSRLCLLKNSLIFQAEFIDYPLLIRLNPNVPWKTRGNGALCLRFTHPPIFEQEIKDTALALWEKNSAVKEKGTDPGIVFFGRKEIPEEFTAFSKKAETSIVTLKEALSLIKKFGGEACGLNTCQGHHRRLGSHRRNPRCDHTYELIAYRTPQIWGIKRQVDRHQFSKWIRSLHLTPSTTSIKRKEESLLHRGVQTRSSLASEEKHPK